MSSHIQEEYPLVGGYGEGRSKLFWIGVIAFICWNILLFILAVVAIAKVNDIDDKPSINFPHSEVEQIATFPAGTVIPQGGPVFNHNGKLYNGAGTSVYIKTETQKLFGVGARNLKVDRFGDNDQDTIVVVWTNATATFMVLGQVSLNAEKVRVWGQPQLLPIGDFYDIVTLARSNFIVTTNTGLLAAIVNTAVGNLTLKASAKFDYPQKLSLLDPHIAALNETAFIISGTNKQDMVDKHTENALFVGSIEWATLGQTTPKVNWINQEPVLFNSSLSSGMHDVFHFDQKSFVLTYAAVGTPYLAAIHGTIDYTKGTIALGHEVTFHGILPQYYISAVQLTNTVGVVVVVDDSDSLSLKAILIHEDPNAINGLYFGTSLVLNPGITAANSNLNAYDSLPFISTVNLKSTAFAVAYSDFANEGKLTTATVYIDMSGTMHLGTNFVIGDAKTLVSLANYTVNTVGLSIHETGQTGYIVIDRENTESPEDATNLAIVEHKGKPFGVAEKEINKDGSGKVVMNGIVDLKKSLGAGARLVPGKLYYARTTGGLVEGPYIGSLDPTTQYYTVGNTLLSLDSVVGFAVSDHELYVQVKA